VSAMSGLWWIVPLAVVACCGLGCSLLGCLLVVHRRVLVTQVMAYGVVPGLVISQALALPAMLGGLIAAVGALLLADWLSNRHNPDAHDAIHTVVLAASLSLGLLLVDGLQQEAELERLLFGDLLLAGPADLGMLLIAVALLLLLLRQRFEALLWLGVDPQAAADAGLSLGWTQRLLAGLSAWILVAAAQAVGGALVMALVCAPAVLALPRARSLAGALMLAALTGVGLGSGGFGLAMLIDRPPGPTIGLVALVAVVLAALLHSHRSAHRGR